jgi:hypothetical protein
MMTSYRRPVRSCIPLENDGSDLWPTSILRVALADLASLLIPLRGVSGIAELGS